MSNHNRKCPISTGYDCIGRVISALLLLLLGGCGLLGPGEVGDVEDAQGTATSCRGWVLMTVQALPP